MRFIQHPTNNRVLGAPKGWDQGQLPCNALPITDALWDGVPAVLSFWTPDASDLVRINAGHPVVLSIVGQTMPPAALYVWEGDFRTPELERLKHVDAEVWNDITAALEVTVNEHWSPDLDELDANLLLDLVRLYRNTVKP
ncbi:MAG: hypothetical protein V4451_04820 [Pseudomonadota bacterium]